MLMPKRTKFRKQHRGRRAGKATRGNTVAFGEYGLVAMDAARTLGVRSTGPLGLCLLPAFVLIAIVPLVLSLFSPAV